MTPFNESWFCVTWQGECPQSSLIFGWFAVLRHLDEQCGHKPDDLHSFTNGTTIVHDKDLWSSLGGHYKDNGGDERHVFSGEVDESVWLVITRITEPFGQDCP